MKYTWDDEGGSFRGHFQLVQGAWKHYNPVELSTIPLPEYDVHSFEAGVSDSAPRGRILLVFQKPGPTPADYLVMGLPVVEMYLYLRLDHFIFPLSVHDGGHPKAQHKHP